MQQRQSLKDKILNIEQEAFLSVALQVFQYQANYNPIYKQYIEYLGVKPQAVQALENIPFLPIRFFKQFSIQTGVWTPQKVFQSSGTTLQQPAKHALKDALFYEKIATKCFQQKYGNPRDYAFLALLPNYLEQGNSSLVYMVQAFIEQSQFPSGFYLNNWKELLETIKAHQAKKIPTILIGVSFALLDLAETHCLDLSETIIMETGGMKGRRKEIVRSELHQRLKKAFRVKEIHSEYGMTELFSQAYSKGKGIFSESPTLKVLVRDITDPFTYLPYGKTGAANLIDLANLDTCAFIATDDLTRKINKNHFELLGRLDASDIRGCNLMVL